MVISRGVQNLFDAFWSVHMAHDCKIAQTMFDSCGTSPLNNIRNPVIFGWVENSVNMCLWKLQRWLTLTSIEFAYIFPSREALLIQFRLDQTYYLQRSKDSFAYRLLFWGGWVEMMQRRLSKLWSMPCSQIEKMKKEPDLLAHWMINPTQVTHTKLCLNTLKFPW